MTTPEPARRNRTVQFAPGRNGVLLVNRQELEEPKRDRPLWQDVIVTAVLVALFVLALWLMARPARASEPLPDLTRTYAELDRMPEAIWQHELTLARYAPWTRGQR